MKKISLKIACSLLLLCTPFYNNAYAKEKHNVVVNLNTTSTSLSLSNVLQQLIIVQTSGDYNHYETSNMIQRISKINNPILYSLYKNNVHIKLINFPITYLSEYSYLRGQIPRGWEGTGYTWDYVPGIGGNPVVARIGYSNYGNMHTSINLELHETAHAIDRYVFQNISYSREFLSIHSQEYNSFSNSSYYYYPEEYFAEAFAYYYLTSETNNTLKKQAPFTYRFIQNLPYRL
ncbi:anthrax toxin lethal factor-related metalloendopeptidase [Bacillus cereus]|uniref:anthrax toxin lethal factor-related metalloendopeptidase n=1 Tax=Bacillus cereus TaxID=1396 RepID=UPI0016423536|nr:hypothetical protein [Bacillus cereus]